ncbi:MAG: enoyl-CoA hydratase/isomerase family protein [Candidatus Eremiobacteraeota bacterium]|nr:enoyl-CoA hydratase/isomerase family protein [Candidatus Eremiobacteraeota bacterium]
MIADVSAPEAVLFELDGHVATITLNRPEKMNALNRAMRKELQEAFVRVKYDPEIWIAILTGAGRAFCSGKDLLEKLPEDDGTVMSNDELYVFQRHIYKPFIVAINGPCLAQGGGFTLSSDIRIMSERATLGWPQVRRGISSVSGPTMFACEVPLPVAMKYLLRGVPMTPQEALEHHVVHEVVPHDELMPTARRWATEIMEAAPLAVQAIKESAVRAQMLPLEERLTMARGVADRVLQSADSKEGILAFKEKRAPVWTGR